jgi:hypothetical protein
MTIVDIKLLFMIILQSEYLLLKKLRDKELHIGLNML